MSKEKIRIRYMQDVNINVGSGIKPGYIWIFEETNSGKWFIDIGGRGVWSKSGDVELRMDKIYGSNIKGITDYEQSIRIDLEEFWFKSIDIIFKKSKDKDQCYKLINDNLVNRPSQKESKKEKVSNDITSKNYKKINSEVKEELAERVAMVVVKVYDLCSVAKSRFVSDQLLEIQNDLIQLAKDLGGHPALPY